MTRNELMEDMYRKNPCVDSGTITIALAKRFPRWQGNYNKMARDFLKSKKVNKNTSHDFDHFMSEAMRFVNRLAENLKGEQWEVTA